MIILGIDPGTLITGFGIIQVTHSGYRPLDFGCIKPPAKMSLAERYKVIYESIVYIIKQHAPSGIAIETQYVDKNVQSAIKLGMARAMALLAAAQHALAIFEYTPSRAKRALVGRGQASKAEVQKMIELLLGLSQVPSDAADALMLALCHLHTVGH